MPLFFQQQVNPDTRLAIWKIEEEEAFFKVPLQRSITHPHKRLQHLAGRYLLKLLYPGFPVQLIQIADTRKPYLENELFHFSISHCGDFAAVIVSTRNRVGVDIERASAKIERIQHKFLSEEEMKIVNGQWSLVSTEIENFDKTAPLTSLSAPLTLIWSCKEAVFKWYGSGEVDFKKHMQVQRLQTMNAKLFQTTICFKKEQEQLLLLPSLFFDALCLSYIVT